MKQIGWLLLCVSSLCLLMACSPKKTGPGEALVAYMEAVQAGDTVTYMHCFARTGQIQEKQMDDLTVHLVSSFAQYLQEKMGGLQSCEVVRVDMKEDGRHATVRLRMHFGNSTDEETEYDMVLEDNVWRICLAT